MRSRVVVTAAAVAMLVSAALVSAQTVAAATTFHVNGSSAFDASTGCTTAKPCRLISQALSLASNGDSIVVAGANSSFNGVYCETLTVDVSVTIEAASLAKPPTVDGGGSGSTCKEAVNSVVTVNTGPLTIDGLILKNGDASNNSASPGYGGGLLDLGPNVDLNHSVITDSTGCSTLGCAGDQGLGGGIAIFGGDVNLTDSTISDNTACTGPGCSVFGGQGGGIYNNSGNVDMVDATISGNVACRSSSTCGAVQTEYAQGGGIYLAEGNATVINSTISRNESCASVATCPGQGGGVNGFGGLVMSNSILSGNGLTDGSGDCTGFSPAFADATPVDGTTPVGNNIVGTTCDSPPASNGDQITNDPRLGPLASNGGIGQTMAVLSGSPALSTGDAATCEAFTVYDGGDQPVAGPGNLDERGVSRDAYARNDCDVGAWDGGQPPPVVSAGNDHACGLTETGRTICWGGDRDDVRTPKGTFAQISSGDDHTCALTTAGSVTCWGDNGHGEASPPSGLKLLQVSSGRNHVCGLVAGGSAVCWGENNDKQTRPPDASFAQVAAGGYRSCGVTNFGSALCWGAVWLGTPVPSQDTMFTHVSVGWSFACGITAGSRALVCWGKNLHGSLTPPSGQFTQVSVSSDHACAVRISGKVACWGSNQFHQSSPPNGTFRQVSAGDLFTCGIRTNESLVCWGHNAHHVVSNAPKSL